MTAILGVSALYHDAAASLVVDGRIVAAAQEERFTRKKHDSSLPVNAMRYCMEETGLSVRDLDFVAFYDQPLLKFDRILETHHAVAPFGFRSFAAGIPGWLKQKLHVPRELRRALGGEYRKRFLFAEHHESHAASAFFPSPFEEAAILTVDGVGEWATATLGTGRENTISLSHELRFPHSLGLLYSAFTYHCGFDVNSGEYKLMGLAPYGEPRFADLILKRLIHLKEDGSFRLDLSFFDYCQGLRMTSRRFSEVFGGPPRKRGEPITPREMDLAASIQSVTEEILLRMVRHLHGMTGMKNLCMAGGVALNCVANGRIVREGPFEKVWVQPAAGDAGGSLGVALLVWHQMLGKPRAPGVPDGQHGSLLGPRYSDENVERFLRSAGARYRRIDSDEKLVDEAARLVSEGKVIGWFQGRMEFGPRSLGNRSILGDPRSGTMQSLINRKIKSRESFRPFAASVLEGSVEEYFEMKAVEAGPYMLVVAPVRREKRVPLSPALGNLRGFENIDVVRSEIPAVTHVDGSSRVQTVDAGRHARFHRLIERFAEQTGYPVLVNTSFNVRDEPIVCSPEDAYRCFVSTELDALAMENFLLLKVEQEPVKEDPRKSRFAFREWTGIGLAGINWNPGRSELRGFSAVWLPLFLALAGVLMLASNRSFRVPALLWTTAVLSVAVGLLRPTLMKPVYLLLTVVTWPVGWIVSHLLLIVVYYGIITPVGLVLRAMGRDSLPRSFDPALRSYWVPRRRSDDPRRWFRQF
jgi:carbamoyltransferase